MAVTIFSESAILVQLSPLPFFLLLISTFTFQPKTCALGNATFLQFQRYPSKKIRYSLLRARNYKRKVPNFWKTPKKAIMGPMLGQGRLQKNSGGCLVRSGEIPSPRQTSIDKTNHYIMNSERSTLVRSLGAPTDPRVTVFTQWPVTCGGRWPGV